MHHYFHKQHWINLWDVFTDKGISAALEHDLHVGELERDARMAKIEYKESLFDSHYSGEQHSRRMNEHRRADAAYEQALKPVYSHNLNDTQAHA